MQKPADEVFMVFREVAFVVGPVVTFPLQAFGTRTEAEANATALNEALGALLPKELVEISGTSVRKAGQTALEMLASLGIASFDHSVQGMPVARAKLIEDPNDGEEVSPGGIITRARH